MLIEYLDGAQEVLYPLRELQSKKLINKTVVQKSSNGETFTTTLRVEGPVCVAGCTFVEGTPGEKLFGDADTEVFKGAVKIYVDKNNNFKSAFLINGDKKTPLNIVKPETEVK